MSMEGSWRVMRGRIRVAVAAAAALLAATALALGGGDGPRTATAAPIDPADLVLTKSDSPDPVATGKALTYTIRVHNNGPDPATNTVVTDGLSGGVDFVSATPSTGDCDRTGSKVVCDLNTVTTTLDRSITIKVTVKKKSGEITNSASVSSDVTDPSPGNNLDTELTKISNPKPIECAGQPVTIFGTLGPDTLVGTVGNDVILADDGDDLIFGLQGGDLICAGHGTDSIRGGVGNDLMLGGRGSDFMRGKRGDDLLRGNRGRDRLRGGRGDDLLAGGPGFDRCRGGRGLDTNRNCER